MKIKLLIGLFLTMFAAVSLQQASAQPVLLTGTSYTNTFDNMTTDQATPPEWTCYTAATVSAPGLIYSFGSASYLPGGNSWRTTSGRFANQAGSYSYGSAYSGATNFVGTEGTQIQTNELNRCLAVRPITATDSGVAFVLKLADTLGRKDFVLFLDSMSLDPTSPRVATWTVDYGFGNTPSSFVPVTTFTTGGSTWSTTRRTITLPNGTVDNAAGPVWIRIVVLSPTTGSGNRPTTGIDNVGLTWDMGVACTPVSITGNPAPVGGFVNGNAGFSVGAVGTAPRFYQWLKNGSIVLTDDGHFGGTTTPALSITTLIAGDAGTYSCVVSNVCDSTLYSQTSGGAALTVSSPPAETIAYLHTLVDPTTWAPTNSSLLYTVTGIITTSTNLTSANTASYYLQDSTGGINLFCTFGSTFRPNMGDSVTAVGYLNSYQGNLELEADLSNPAQGVAINSTGNVVPNAQLVAWDNLYQYGTNAYLNYNVQGALVMLTNVYFGTNVGIVTTNGNYNLIVTNAAGKLARVYLTASQVYDLTNRTIPSFASSVQGPLVASATGYEVSVTRWADIVTAVPVAPVSSVKISQGAGNTLNISYAGGSASQFVLVGTNNVTAPLANWPVIQTTNGTTPATFNIPIGAGQMFYKIKSQ